VYIICVPTPIKDDYSVNTGFIESAGVTISEVLKKGDLVILESTIEPGITKNVLGKLLENLTSLVPGKDFHLSYSAERVIPGNIFEELKSNHRIVGGIDTISAQKAANVYSKISNNDVIITDLSTAEISKLFENTFRDINIAIANTFLLISKRYGVNVWEAIKLANMHPRVNILNPGNGVGGHCIAVDPWFLYKNDEVSSLIFLARTINSLMPLHFVDFIKSIKNKYTLEKHIGILGLSYKPDADDLRESPSIEVIKRLQGLNYKILICDPILTNGKILGLTLEDLKTILKKTSFLVISVGHSYFMSSEFKSILEGLNRKVIVVQAGPFIDSSENIEVHTFGKE
jgi:UDP-N-acetyl-D-mannosaminuronic acid dehydrogenase